jgi:hypothetical protein
VYANLRLPAVHHRSCRPMCILYPLETRHSTYQPQLQILKFMTFIMTILLISYSKALILIHSHFFYPWLFQRSLWEYFCDFLIPTLLHTIIEPITLFRFFSPALLPLAYGPNSLIHSFIH